MSRWLSTKVFPRFARFTVGQAACFLLAAAGYLILVCTVLYPLIYRGEIATVFVLATLILALFLANISWVVLFATIGRTHHWQPSTVRMAPSLTAFALTVATALLFPIPSMPFSVATAFFSLSTSLANHGRELVYPDLGIKDRDPLDIIELFPKSSR